MAFYTHLYLLFFKKRKLSYLLAEQSSADCGNLNYLERPALGLDLRIVGVISESFFQPGSFWREINLEWEK